MELNITVDSNELARVAYVATHWGVPAVCMIEEVQKQVAALTSEFSRPFKIDGEMNDDAGELLQHLRQLESLDVNKASALLWLEVSLAEHVTFCFECAATRPEDIDSYLHEERMFVNDAQLQWALGGGTRTWDRERFAEMNHRKTYIPSDEDMMIDMRNDLAMQIVIHPERRDEIERNFPARLTIELRATMPDPDKAIQALFDQITAPDVAEEDGQEETAFLLRSMREYCGL